MNGNCLPPLDGTAMQHNEGPPPSLPRNELFSMIHSLIRCITALGLLQFAYLVSCAGLRGDGDGMVAKRAGGSANGVYFVNWYARTQIIYIGLLK